MSSLNEKILDKHAAGLDAFANHAFFAAIEEDSLSETAARAYFINERCFVDTAVAVFAYTLAKAPTLSARRHLHTILNGLLYSQFDLFDAIFARLGIPPEARTGSPRSNTVKAVCDGFTAIARDGSYASSLAAMLVAESTYARVSERLMRSPPRDALLRDWFALHTRREFLDGVTWLKRELDEQGHIGVTLDDVSGAVSTAIALELTFHDEPLRTTPATTQ